MHWLEAWRQKNDVSRGQLARAANCSVRLITLIEETGTIIQKDIAGRIADCTGATQSKYRKLVHKNHWNAWTPDPERFRCAAAKLERNHNGKKTALEDFAPCTISPAAVKKTEPQRKPKAGQKKVARKQKTPMQNRKSKAIYMINTDCKPVVKFISLAHAMAATGNCASNIQSRCEEQVAKKEFTAGGYTFRYADDWDKGRVDMDGLCEAAEKFKSQRAKGVFYIGNKLMLSYEGRIGTVAEWSKIIGICQSTIRDRIRADMPIEAILSKERKERSHEHA